MQATIQDAGSQPLKPVFIIGLHRTGSTLLRNILDANSRLAMATDEMELYHPWKRTFADHFKSLGDLRSDETIWSLVEFIYTGTIQGTFWKDYRALGIPREKVFSRIRESDKSLRSVVSILLDEYRSKSGKERVGVKYPLHFSKLHVLLKWYPDSKVICLARDIRAVCASKLNDPATCTRKAKRPWLAPLIHYATLGLFIFDYIWFTRIYRRYRNCPNVRLVRYEDMVSDPDKTIGSLCDFCEIPFEPQMSNANGKPSSFSGIRHKGPDLTRIHNWQTRLSRFDRVLINSLTKRSMVALGYGK